MSAKKKKVSKAKVAKAKTKIKAKKSKVVKSKKATSKVKAKVSKTKVATKTKVARTKAKPKVAKKKVIKPKKTTKKLKASKAQPVKAKAPKTKEVKKKAAKSAAESFDLTPYAIAKDEAYMNDTQLEHFRMILGSWKQQLMQEVDSTVVHMKQDATSYPDPLDRASQEEGFNLELRTRDRERKLIKKIEQALDTIETREYGYCESCGAEIGIRRLEARPTADKCIDCKTFEEIREKQVGY